MNTTKLPIIIFVLLGLSIIAFQYTQNAKLKKELKAQNSKEIGSSGEGSLNLAVTGKGLSKSSSDSKKESVTKKDSKNLIIHDDIKHCFFSRKNGVSKGIYESLNCGIGSNDKEENVKKNLDIVSKNFNK